MKKLIFSFSLFMFVLINYGQNAFKTEQVININNAPKASLFSILNTYIAQYYKSANDVIQMSDKEIGIIVGKGIIDYSHSKFNYVCFSGWINYTFTIKVKDDKFKVEFSNFTHEIMPGNSISCKLGLITDSEIYTNRGLNKTAQNNVWNDIKVTVGIFSKKNFSEIEKYVNDNITSINDTDW